MYKLNEKDWLTITEGLRKKKEDGTSSIDGIMKSGDCPFCLTRTEGEEVPLMVDREKLTFRTKCCSFSGGCCNYLMVLNKWTMKQAIEYLLDFVRSS